MRTRDEIAQTLASVSHRPWPLPRAPWVQTQVWQDLLFAHWPLPPEALRPHVPRQLELDIFEEQAWVAVTPFTMSDVRLRGLPPLPTASHFPECNVRTYVTLDGKPGVYFFSLDIPSLLAIAGARVWYALPYFYARMFADKAGEEVRYYCRRTDVDRARPEMHGNVAPDSGLLRGVAELRAVYRPVGPVRLRAPGTREHFLTERYCLYTVKRERVYRAEIHHVQWPLQDATAEFAANTMAQADGLRLPDTAPLLHYARRLRVLVWAPQRVK